MIEKINTVFYSALVLYKDLYYFPDTINIWSHIPFFLLFPVLPPQAERVNIKVHLLLFK